MCKWIITIIFINFMATIYAPRWPDRYFIDSEITAEHAEKILDEIDHLGALPVVLFQIKENHKYILRSPEIIFRAAIENKKMVNAENMFTLTGSRKCIFFCPKPESEVTPGPESVPPELCLVPVQFNALQELRCTKEPIPVTEKSVQPVCAFQSGTSYSVAYKICDRTDSEQMYKYENWSELLIFQYCYHEDNKLTLFTTHSIISPKLLESKLLHRERNLNYLYYSNRSQNTKHAELINQAIHGVKLIIAVASVKEVNSWFYKVQKLVPSEDMALATLRKPTFEFDNLELQHSWLFDIWNQMNDIVRREVIQIYGTNEYFVFHTGVVGNRIPSSDQQMYNTWVKIIIAEGINDRVQHRGVAVLMNNFLNVRYIQNNLVEFCMDDLCSDYFKHEVARLGAQMRCCRITPKIGALFGVEIDPNLEYHVLQIPGLIIET